MKMPKFLFKIIFKWMIKFFEKLDFVMKKNGWPRWRRKQFFRDFVSSPESRKDLYKGFMDEVRKY